jgi:hypothetical protein
MVEIKNSKTIEGDKLFYVPDVISFLNFVVSSYNDPIAPDPKELTEQEYDDNTFILKSNLRE